MNWIIWRQHRKQIIYFGVGVAAFAAIVGVLGAQFAHAYHAWLRTDKQGPFTPGGAVRYMPLTSIVAPLLLGMFWGAPLIAKEYEAGTNKLAWTQSVTRRQWLTAKLLWMIGIAGLYGLVLSLAVGWTLRTENALMADRFEWVHFDVQGLMPVVYAMFAVALGAFLGAWKRRAVLAIGLTLGVFVALQGAIGLYVRQHYMAAYVTTTTSLDKFPKGGGAVTTLSSHTTGPKLPTAYTDIWTLGWKYSSPAYGCPPTSDCTQTDISTVKWQPANRYWPFQFIEAGIYAGLTAVLVGSTYWLVLKRDVA